MKEPEGQGCDGRLAHVIGQSEPCSIYPLPRTSRFCKYFVLGAVLRTSYLGSVFRCARIMDIEQCSAVGRLGGWWASHQPLCRGSNSRCETGKQMKMNDHLFIFHSILTRKRGGPGASLDDTSMPQGMRRSSSPLFGAASTMIPHLISNQSRG